MAPETALGRVVAIRSEKDKNVIKHFTADQRRIYDEWQSRNVKEMSQENFEKGMADLEKIFAEMCGQGVVKH